MRTFLFAIIGATLLLAGCVAKTEPISAHGKPVAFWVDELQNSDADARKLAVTNLGHVGTADPAVLPALIDAVADADAVVRDAAVLALLNIGPDAADATDALNEALGDKDATVRVHAAKALARIQGGK